jgi:hypothetical protein
MIFSKNCKLEKGPQLCFVNLASQHNYEPLSLLLGDGAF